MGSSNGKPVVRQEDIAALAKSSGLQESQVKQYSEAFLRDHPDGKMKPKDFHDMIEKALPKLDTSNMEKHVYRIYDTNNDGYINFTEFMIIFFIMSDRSSEEVLTKIFRVFDVNSDGTITKKEMTKLIRDMYSLLKEEDPSLAAKDLVAKSAFAEMDSDQDGKVTLEEFISACLGQEKLSKMLALKVIDIFVDEEEL